MKLQYFTQIGLLKAKLWLCRHSYFRAILKRSNRIMNTERTVLLWWRVWLVHRPHSPIDWLTTRTLSFQHKQLTVFRLASVDWEGARLHARFTSAQMHWKQLLIAQFICEKQNKTTTTDAIELYSSHTAYEWTRATENSTDNNEPYRD